MSKRVYRIGEAAKLLGVKTSTLRFWEEEFSQIRPRRTDTGQRYYSGKDMQLLRRIHALLHEKGMTISGVQKMLKRPEKEQSSLLISLGTVKSVRLAGSLMPLSVPNPIAKSSSASFHTPFHASVHASGSASVLAAGSGGDSIQNVLPVHNNLQNLGQNLLSKHENRDFSPSDATLLKKLDEQSQQMTALKTEHVYKLIEIKNELEELLCFLKKH